MAQRILSCHCLLNNFMHPILSLLLSHERLGQKQEQFTGLNHIELPHLIPEILFTLTFFLNKKYRDNFF